MTIFNKTKQFSLMAVALAGTMTFSSCKKDDDDNGNGNGGTPMMSASYNYAFNNGQVGEGTAYQGNHDRNLTAKLELKEKSEGTDVMVTLTNTVDGEMYMVHAHDMADPSSTPNGTPYNEAPNGDVLSLMITGNGGSVSATFSSNRSFSNLKNDYEGFFVVHDPLQQLSTVDLTTYIVLGVFAEDMPATNPPNRMMSYTYDFNTGQVGAGTAYSGPHSSNLMATLTLEEMGSETKVSVKLTNTVNGEMYMVHAHDAADPSTTPNGTPYNEAPNGDVLSLMINGNGGDAMADMTSTLSFDHLKDTYEGFFVVHDPLQALSTTDLTTYLVVGVFAN